MWNTIKTETILLCLILILLGSPGAFCRETHIALWNLPEMKIFHGIREAVREYERRTGIVIDMAVVSNNPSDHQKLMTALAAGTPPI